MRLAPARSARTTAALSRTNPAAATHFAAQMNPSNHRKYKTLDSICEQLLYCKFHRVPHKLRAALKHSRRLLSLFVSQTKVRQRPRTKKPSWQRCTAVAIAALWTRHHQLTRRRLAVFLDRPPTTTYNFFSYSSTCRGWATKFFRVQSGGLFSTTAHLRILIAA
jgi:hypothetical protein